MEPEAELAYDAAMMMDHLSTMAQTLILLSTREFNMVRLNDRHCTGSSIMAAETKPLFLGGDQGKRRPLSHGMVFSLLSVGKGLFMGITGIRSDEVLIMDLVDESKPALSVMTDILRLLQVNKTQMSRQAQESFSSNRLMRGWSVRDLLPMRKAKMVMEESGEIFRRGKGKERFPIRV